MRHHRYRDSGIGCLAAQCVRPVQPHGRAWFNVVGQGQAGNGGVIAALSVNLGPCNRTRRCGVVDPALVARGLVGHQRQLLGRCIYGPVCIEVAQFVIQYGANGLQRLSPLLWRDCSILGLQHAVGIIHFRFFGVRHARGTEMLLLRFPLPILEIRIG